jgi:transcription antitermination factor NusG
MQNKNRSDNYRKQKDMLKVSENPPMIWPENRPLEDFTGVWWVAHTKSRNEKALAWQLQRRDIQYFLPMNVKVSRRKGRTYRPLFPLFPGYVFFCAVEDTQRLHVLTTNRVANLIEVHDKEQFVAELSAIEKVLRLGQPLLPHKYLKCGQMYRMTGGPLMGIEGQLTRIDNAARLILKVDMLGQAVSVSIDADMVEPVQ